MPSKLTQRVFNTLHHSMTNTSRLDLTSLIHFDPHDTNLSISGPAPRTKWLRTYLVNRVLAMNTTPAAAMVEEMAEHFMRLLDEGLLDVLELSETAFSEKVKDTSIAIEIEAHVSEMLEPLSFEMARLDIAALGNRAAVVNGYGGLEEFRARQEEVSDGKEHGEDPDECAYIDVNTGERCSEEERLALKERLDWAREERAKGEEGERGKRLENSLNHATATDDKLNAEYGRKATDKKWKKSGCGKSAKWQSERAAKDTEDEKDKQFAVLEQAAEYFTPGETCAADIEVETYGTAVEERLVESKKQQEAMCADEEHKKQQLEAKPAQDESLDLKQLPDPQKAAKHSTLEGTCLADPETKNDSQKPYQATCENEEPEEVIDDDPGGKKLFCELEKRAESWTQEELRAAEQYIMYHVTMDRDWMNSPILGYAPGYEPWRRGRGAF